jgi:hypothetical protein
MRYSFFCSYASKNASGSAFSFDSLPLAIQKPAAFQKQ